MHARRKLSAVTSRETVKTIAALGDAGRCAFWLGNPHAGALAPLHGYFGTKGESALRKELRDDFRWIPATASCRVNGGKAAAGGTNDHVAAEAALFAGIELAGSGDDAEWPDPARVDFSGIITELKQSGDVFRASGFWSPFFQIVSGIFGVENYFINMYKQPDLVHRVTQRVVDFYVDANDRLFAEAEGEIDAFFFGNDLGSQQDTLIGPELFREFVLPYMKQLIDVAGLHGIRVILHSCGSVHRFIPDLIEAGIDALHPLQAGARKMDAETLAVDFGGKIAFFGGIDAQKLLVNGGADDVAAEVRRIKRLLGPSLIVSPGSEVLLPDVPPGNVEAMARAALEV